jgi:hypothetical protein
MLAWLSMTGKMPDSPEELLMLVYEHPHDASGHRQPPEQRSLSVTRWEVMRAVYNRESGTQRMQLPGSWQETFEAGEELAQLFRSMPPETVASWIVERNARKDAGAPDEELKQLDDKCLRPYGISEELEQRALGPDVEEISVSEKRWRMAEHTHDAFASPWGWEMHKHASRIEGGK